ncbi:putative RNA polymerase II subunit B1 CTD phosphatase RPAP2 homolog [Teleopsis dalmanni]|uniref:putative RNA polymerase II subunit B1 CTD phosphatase RPAP2 homolog n=1 Tax=Teleopsis dalmanni TaxID=139649 RepID=UPI0018CCB86E|nr:putative RNA polymerase II subunit B1 CTD phosphatase RPAP2 homolog [Teleopsis dalmanni]
MCSINKTCVHDECQKERKLLLRKAVDAVEFLLEPGIAPGDLLVKLNDLAQCHFDDVVEERFILKVCGYPLCSQKLTNIPAQKYVIEDCKVYDITNSKKFCCYKCYKRSIYIKEQLSEDILFVRPKNKDLKLLE